ncbi:MAG: helix-turn-helix transcriptional regulator [Bosea sp. (in: a-proteobacteria)]|nr:helix-turn-helix transcriptional regulator [Bosea sp. (in: a-proteobacteria)]
MLIAARRSAGLTQEVVAKRLDKPQSFVAKYENGERRIDVIELIRIAKALDSDPLKIVAELASV